MNEIKKNNKSVFKVQNHENSVFSSFFFAFYLVILYSDWIELILIVILVRVELKAIQHVCSVHWNWSTARQYTGKVVFVFLKKNFSVVFFLVQLKNKVYDEQTILFALQ